MRRLRQFTATACLVTSATWGLGCWAIAKQERDIDRTPVVNTGAGASILYPGQSAPAHPGNHHPREAGYGAPATPQAGGYGASQLPPGAVGSGAAQPPPEYSPETAQRSQRGGHGGGGGGITMIGGATTEETKHISINEEPQWLKYAALPFAIVAAPFKYAAEAIRGEPEAGPEVPRVENRPAPAPQAQNAPTDYDSARLQDMERELAQRSAQTRPHAPRPTLQRERVVAPGRTGSIADELAALRRGNQTSTPAPQTSSPKRTTPSHRARGAHGRSRSEPSRNTAGQVDRDGDGHIDQWIERDGGRIVRESFDENFDGRIDRSLVYDPQARAVIRIEEDSDFDGRLDAWTALRDGKVVARRVDTDGDGHIDSWSSYREGVLTRLERDANGDGLRDHVASYRAGRLAREERDEDGDGLNDLVTWYDDAERVLRVEEDANGDGQMDVVSHYEGGRLTRRDVIDTAVLDTPSTTESN